MSENSDKSHESESVKNPTIISDDQFSEKSLTEKSQSEKPPSEIPLDLQEGVDDDYKMLDDGGDGDENKQTNKIDIDVNSGDLCLLILEKSDKFKDFIGVITETTDDYILLKNEVEQQIKINIDDDNNYTLKLDDGTNIVEIFPIKEVDPEEVLKDDDIFKDDDIKLKVEEVDKQFKKYNDSEIKEDFIFEIINLYNRFDDELLIKKITEMSYSFLDLIKENKSISEIDRTDVLSFVKSMVNNDDFKLPDFILPIVSLKKKLFQEDDEIIIENEYINVNDTATELTDKYNEMNADGNGYIKMLEALFNNKYKSYTNNLNKNGFLINYDGNVIRECLDGSNPCEGLNNYIIDLLKSRKDIYRLDNGEKENYVKYENFNITGLLFLPKNLVNHTLKLNLNNLFNLYENTQLYNRSLSIKSFRNNILNNQLNNKKINNDSLKEEYKNELTAYLFDIHEEITIEKLSELLIKILPNNKSIINSIDKNIFKQIYNFEDLEKLLLFYNIKINDLLQDDKNEIIDLIKQNIDNYEKIYKKLLKSVIKPLKKVKYITKELDIEEKITLSRDYILRNKNIIERNYLINRFIKKYCREARDQSENNNWLYSSKGPEKILCKHYLYLSKIDKNPEYYDNLKSIFCPQSEEGHICCSNCGHLIDNVEFSTFQGFSEGKVINTTEVLNQGNVDNISEGNTFIKNEINKVIKSFGVKLFQNDLESIVDILLTFDSNHFTDFRFNKRNYISNLSNTIKVKGKDGTGSDKDKKKFIKSYRRYIENLNVLLSISFLTFIHIQISNNVYKMNLSDLFNILEYDDKGSWKLIASSSNYESINTKVITYINKKLNNKLKSNMKLLTQKDIIKEDFERDFINTIKYFLQPQFNLYDKINRYFILNKSNDNLFTKESWPTYKPLYDNKLVLNINKYISSKDEEMKQYFINNDSLENISLLKDINKIVPKYIEYKLPVSTLIGNPSYKRLYTYSLKLYGKSKIFPILNLLAKKFSDDLNNENINTLLAQCHFRNDKFSQIKFNHILNIIIGEITKYEIENTDDKDNILKFKHINLNNTEYLLLSGEIIKYYQYIPAEIFNNSSYSELSENNSIFLEKLFKNYCLDNSGELIVNSIDENILNYYLIDYHVELSENIPECKKVSIPFSEENFMRIMDYLPNKNKLPNSIYIPYNDIYSNDDIFIYLNFNTNIENRLQGFFNVNEYQEDDDTINKILEVIDLVERHKEDHKLYDESDLIKRIDDININIKDSIEEYFNNVDSLFNNILRNENYISKYNELQLDRFKAIKISGVNNIENSSLILDKLIQDIDDTYIYKRLIDDIFTTLSRLKNKYQRYNHIRKDLYKLSETNIDSFNEYIDINEFLLHDDLYFKRLNKELEDNLKYSGFKQYIHENNNIYFEELYNYINKYNKDINKLKGITNNIFNNELILKINKFIFIFIINKISEYINALMDDESDIYKINKEKLDELDIEEININNNIICLSRFLLDIIINMYEKYYDPSWVYISEQLLNKSIMKQVSREKQTYLKKTTQMTKEQKYQNDLMNGMGKGSLYKELEKGNTKFAESGEWEQMAMDEKIEHQKELFMSSDDNVTEEVHVLPENLEQDEGYEYNIGEGDGYDDGTGEDEIDD